MKIDLSKIDESQFYVNQHIIAGQVVYLIVAHQIGTKWTPDNMHFRSSVWDSDGNPVSLSFKKFFNFGEHPDLSPIPKTLDGATIVEKMDGSTCIISKWRGQFIIRTRGAIDVSAQPNVSEIEVLKTKYPKIFMLDAASDTWDFSIITEWVTPTNQIVIKHNDVDFILIGVIRHSDYSLMSQSDLDVMASELDMKRPSTYTFSSVEDLLLNVDKWDGREGVVIYCRQGRQLLKVKAAKYLFLHRMKSELSSVEKIIDVWISQGYPSYNDFYNYIQTTFDYELAIFCQPQMSKICDAWKTVQQIEAGMKRFVDSIRELPSRREQALKIISSYGGETNNRSGMVFTLLDNKPLTSEMYKKLLFQCLKNNMS